jgi:hypothetical protein
VAIARTAFSSAARKAIWVSRLGPSPVPSAIQNVRLAVASVPDGLVEIRLPRKAPNRQNGVVERLGFRVIGAVNTYVVNHEKIVARVDARS